MPSINATVLPDGSIDGRVLAESGFVARQAKRLLVLGGLIVGFWILASLIHSAHASAAPSPSTPSGVTTVIVGSVTNAVTAGPVAKIVPSQVAAAVIDPVVGSVENVTGRIDSALPIGHIVGAVRATTHPLVPVVQRAPRTAVQITRPTAQPVTATGGAATTGNMASTTHRMQSSGPLSQHPASPAAQGTEGLRLPNRAPAPAVADGPLGTAGGSTTHSSGGNAAGALPVAAFAPTSLQMSASSSHRVSMLRGVCERPSFSPD